MTQSLTRRVYDRAPGALRTAVASARGYYLRWWRYGPETNRLVEEATEREYWSPERWRAWREERLAFLLHQAATRVPYYREHWAARRREGDRSSWERLENWPILTKDRVRASPAAFLVDGRSPHQLFAVQTSGTSGTPLRLWRSRATNRAWFALFEARWRRWYGVSRHDWWAMLGGQLVVPARQSRPPFWVRNYGLRQIYLSTYHIAPQHAQDYLSAIRDAGVNHLLGYASSMHHLAMFALEQNLEPVPLRVAISNAEPLFEHQREAIERVFRCPVRNTYGMGEAVAAASECEAGTLHLWPEVGLLEVLDDEHDMSVAPGTVGRFVCTGLLNPEMPLVRYEVGDRGALNPEQTGCSCARTLPSLQSIEGRLNDSIVTADGRRIFWLNPAFYALPLNEAQVIQEAVDRIRVRVVPSEGYSDEVEKVLAARLRERVGDMEVRFERISQIPRSANGKFRAVLREWEPAGGDA